MGSDMGNDKYEGRYPIAGVAVQVLLLVNAPPRFLRYARMVDMVVASPIFRLLAAAYVLLCFGFLIQLSGIPRAYNGVSWALYGNLQGPGCLMEQPRPHTVPGPNFTVEVGYIEDFRSRLTGAATNPWMLNPYGIGAPRRECARRVQKNLHFIWMGPMKRGHVENILGFMTKNPKWDVLLWVDRPLDEASARAFASAANRPAGPIRIMSLQENDHRFRNRDLIAKEPNLSGKSNYLRMEVVYLHGGIYMDTDSVAVGGFDDFGELFRWPFMSQTMSSYKNVCSCIFSFERGSAFVDFAMDAARENCVWFYRCGVLSGAGSPFLTAALVLYNMPDILLIDQKHLCLRTQDGDPDENIMYQTFEANWIKKS